ncbi:hypothetical protein [Nostoc sp. FACHB-110]|uniref:hypothetical protein n=1 Tax=Nostoc sp. FACHB-110 TaxID=2692834 RepID=UPI0016883D5F|nr:hypothetical protein [Nostoc sp. FACHB-110]MBD2440847.1 hypothetical protein [Nostoc sp. FACHB-110]
MATRDFELGSMDGLPEFRVVMDGNGFLLTPVLETRKTTLKAFVSIERSDNINEETWKAFGQCIMIAAAGAAFAGFTPGGIAAMPIFMHTFGTCATSKGLELAASQIRFRTETFYGEWERFTFGETANQNLNKPKLQPKC